MNKQRIIDALRVIRETCIQAGDCKMCPLRKGKEGMYCSVTNGYPEDWELADDVNGGWRAFKLFEEIDR